MKSNKPIQHDFRKAGGRATLGLLVASLLALVTLRALAQSTSGAQAGYSMGYPTNTAKALELGQTDARRDLSNGVVKVKSSGLPGLATAEYDRLLKERCNVELQPIAGCIVNEGLLAYQRGYNEVSVAVIYQKFGTNIFSDLYKEAEALLEKRITAEALTSGKNNYAVKSGDTLTKIARIHSVTIRELEQANPGVNPTRLQVNQKIVIPKKKQP